MGPAPGDIIGRIGLVDFNRDVIRNIASIRISQDLFDDLSRNANDWAAAQNLEMQHKPPLYTNRDPALSRPFEEADWANAIQWPFKNWQTSRFSNGTYGVWYGSLTEQTTIYESAYHWHAGLLSDAGFENENVIAERKLYKVQCRAGLLDLRPLVGEFAEVMHPTDYTTAQALGARLHREGHPGLVAPSVRDNGGENIAVLNPSVLSNPRVSGFLTYRLANGAITVERAPGTTLLQVQIVR